FLRPSPRSTFRVFVLWHATEAVQNACFGPSHPEPARSKLSAISACFQPICSMLLWLCCSVQVRLSLKPLLSAYCWVHPSGLLQAFPIPLAVSVKASKGGSDS